MIAFELIHCIYLSSCTCSWKIESISRIFKGWHSLESSRSLYVAFKSLGTMWLVASARNFVAICWLWGLTTKNQNASQVKFFTLPIFSSPLARSCLHWFSSDFAFGSVGPLVCHYYYYTLTPISSISTIIYHVIYHGLSYNSIL